MICLTKLLAAAGLREEATKQKVAIRTDLLIFTVTLLASNMQSEKERSGCPVKSFVFVAAQV